MSRDFVIVPPGKSGNSVKLKAKNIRELRMETLQLEKQNQEMEQRLNQLRQSMSKEKEERERSNAFHWRSGQTGNQSQSPDKENTGKVSSGKTRLKVLKNLDPEPEKHKIFSRTSDVTTTERPKLRGRACGQCENKSALLMCLECGENYCAACFSKIHQKGALKLHRTMAIQGKSQDAKLDVSHAFRNQANADEVRGALVQDNGGMAYNGGFSSNEKHDASREAFMSEERSPYVPPNTKSLLHGSFNEEESAKYFNDALLEWRKESSYNPQPPLETKTDGTGNSEAQTTLTVLAKPLAVEFKENGLSYMDKLVLKKYRRTPVHLSPRKHLDKEKCSVTISDNGTDECHSLTAEEMDAHERYVALFQAEEHVSGDMIHEPALKIVELDKGPEEDLEESKVFWVTEVESDHVKRHNSVSESEKHVPSAKMSSVSPERAVKKHRNVPLRSTYSVVRTSSQDSNTVCMKDHLLTASHSEDSKSIQYKSFKDSQSSDTALMVNVPQQFERSVLRERNKASEYQGLKGFFILETDQAEVKTDNCPPRTPDPNILEEVILCTGHTYWKPDSSIIDCEDYQVNAAKIQTQYNNHFIEHNLSPRCLQQRSGRYSGRPNSRKSMHQTSVSHSTSRPSSTLARPMSRAASEISEIERIDSGEDDLFLEDENEKETLAVLEKELMTLYQGDKKTRLPAASDVSFQLTSHSKRLPISEEQTLINRSSVHPLQSFCESESDEEEDLQDKLNVLSLQ